MASLGEYAKQKGIKYFLVSFVDLFGTMRAKIVPATAIDAISKSGAGFAGFAVWFDMTPAHPDILAMPDPDSVIQLPWKPEVAWVTGDLIMDGKAVEQNPRQVLKRVITKAAAQGYELKSGVECEYFLIQPDGKAISDAADIQAKPCYDQQALMRRYDVIAEICDNMIALGWRPYQNDHEDANGQFEMNWEYDSALKTADRHAFFKYMVKSIAEKQRSCPSPSRTSPGTVATRTCRCGRPRPARICSRTPRGNSASPPWATTSSRASCTRPRRSPRSPIRR
jgi:glutamine synthetase